MYKKLIMALAVGAMMCLVGCDDKFADPSDYSKDIESQQYELLGGWSVDSLRSSSIYFYEVGLTYTQRDSTFFHKRYELCGDTLKVGMREGKAVFSGDGAFVRISGFDEPEQWVTEPTAEGPFINGYYVRQ